MQNLLLVRSAHFILCLKFCDKKDIYMLTSQHDESTVPVTSKRRGWPSTSDTGNRKPMCVLECNANMVSVDKQNQILKHYSIAKEHEMV